MTSSLTFAEIQFDMGVEAIDDGRFDAAVEYFRTVIDEDPHHAFAHNNLGSALGELGRLGEAARAFHRATQIDAHYVEAHFNLAVALLRLRQLLDSLAYFARTVDLDPAHVEALNGLGVILVKMGRGEEAIPAFERALTLDPDHQLARAQLMFQLARRCDWKRLEPSLSAVPKLGIDGPPVPPFTMLPFDDHPMRHRLRSERFAAANFGGIVAQPVPPPPACRPDRLRIGYFSSDLHDHATLFLAINMLESHDRERFDIHCYSYGRDSDGQMRQRLTAAIDGFHDISGLDDATAAEAARADGIDIAIDLKGLTRGNRMEIFAFRAAPIQIAFLGYPGTSGAPFIDYLIADPIVITDRQRDAYSERLITMPDCYQPNDCNRMIAESPPSRQDAGLPADGFVFCCFNSSYKITPAEFDIWMDLLRRVEGSVLWLITPSSEGMANLHAAAQARGIDPLRLVFGPKLPHADHLARHRHADLFLDTFNCNAHTTASDALWSGLPVLTKLGESFAARVAGSLLNAVGLKELIANNTEEYVELAFQLATDPARLDAIRTKLATNRMTMPLFNSKLFTRHIEAGYDLAYARFLDRKNPADIAVPRT